MLGFLHPTDKRTLSIAVCVAALITTAIGTVHQGNPPSPRFYVAMPGLAVGLLSGFAGGPSFLVIPLAIAANALTYYFLLILFIRFAVFCRNRSH